MAEVESPLQQLTSPKRLQVVQFSSLLSVFSAKMGINYQDLKPGNKFRYPVHVLLRITNIYKRSSLQSQWHVNTGSTGVWSGLLSDKYNRQRFFIFGVLTRHRRRCNITVLVTEVRVLRIIGVLRR